MVQMIFICFHENIVNVACGILHLRKFSAAVVTCLVGCTNSGVHCFEHPYLGFQSASALYFPLVYWFSATMLPTTGP
jgi:hypothetical protein